MTIDIGSPAIDREYGSTSEHVYILKENPANLSGRITEIKVYLANPCSNLTVFTAYEEAADTFTTRDYYNVGALAAGYHELAVDMDVETGDYIGWREEVADATWRVEADITGQGYWSKISPRPEVPFSGVLFLFAPNRTQSLYGTGVSTPQVPTVTTDPATGVGVESATLNGTLNDQGAAPSDCGFEWGETDAYGNTTPTQSRTTGQTFAQTITGLDPNKTYHFRAFATNPAGTSYGADRMFTTLVAVPTVTTDPASGVAVESATLNGTLDDQGVAASDCGFEWGLDTGYGTITSPQTKGTGETFSQALGGLFPGTTYHFRAFATNSAGTSYGADRSFTTALVITRAYALARQEL